jgi:hypothetical protein
MDDFGRGESAVLQLLLVIVCEWSGVEESPIDPIPSLERSKSNWALMSA